MLRRISIFEANVIPPWGLLNTDFKGAVSGVKLPPHWLITTERSPGERLDHFQKWLQETMLTVNELLWPRYDPQEQEWKGESVGFMRELTITDLDLMLELQSPRRGARHFDTLVNSPVRALDFKTHQALFGLEDEVGGSRMFSGFPYYNRCGFGVPNETGAEAAVSNACFSGDATKKGNVSFEFKNNLQRPRAMQMALRFKRAAFEYRDAGTSVTPSMSSGHCLQGVLCVGGLIEQLLSDGIALAPSVQQALGQWAVDIGDRRVLAGVHYPSDNLCSWLLFLRMADHVFSRPEVRQIVGAAIEHQSYVFGAIRQSIEDGHGEEYKPVVAELKSLFRK